ncbi:MAG: AMP-binding protein [Pseudoflavonifractor sp.]|nr:AMP-binding protein [Pseudoflavonifractor sp.]
MDDTRHGLAMRTSGTVNIQGMTPEVEKFLDQWFDSNDYITAHTSGSTGRPKEIRLFKSDMRASAEATCRFFGIDGRSTLLLPLSAGYIAGKMMIVRSLLSGARLIVEQPSNQPKQRDYGLIDLLAIVPSQLAWFISNPSMASRVKSVIIGGGAMSPEQEKQAAALPWHAYATYGMTETCSHVALRDVSAGERLFKALPGITFSTDDRGCLAIDMPAFSFGRVVTNDIVTLADNRTFEWRGRHDNVINSGGIKIFPEELERRLDFIDKPFFIIGRPSPKWGEEVVLYIEDESASIDILLLHDSITRHIGRVLAPKEIVVVSRFERTDSGKIKRRHY